jgi:hypothetical protein
MPAVLTYWALPGEESELLEFIKASGEVVAVRSAWSGRKEDLILRPLIALIEQHDQTSLYIGLAQYLHEGCIEARLFDGKRLFGVSDLRSNVVGYSRAKFHSGQLSRFNLYAYWSHIDPHSSNVIHKDEEFVKWGKKVLNWARRWTPERIELNGFPYPATRRAKAALCKGEIAVIL